MNKTFKNIITAGVMASFALAPFAAFAEDGGSVPVVPKSSTSFCVMIKDKTVNDFKKMGERGAMMQDKWNNRDGKIDGKRAENDAERLQNETDRQAKLDALVTKWESNAKTDAEKSAIADFKVSLAGAIADRNGSIATTVASSRLETDAARTAARTEITAALTTLQTAIGTALTRAQTDCTNGVASATVRTNFAADMKTATDAFKAATGAVHADTKTEIKTIHEDRKTENAAARGGFRNFFESFRNSFLGLFGRHNNQDQ